MRERRPRRGLSGCSYRTRCTLSRRLPRAVFLTLRHLTPSDSPQHTLSRGFGHKFSRRRPAGQKIQPVFGGGAGFSGIHHK